jgi:hypothetical protein
MSTPLTFCDFTTDEAFAERDFPTRLNFIPTALV